MKIEQCTKAELIEIIRTHLNQSTITLALRDIQYKRDQAEANKADALLEQASEELNLYLEIVNKANEDPRSVTLEEREKAVEHHKNYLDLDEKWKKIMFKGEKKW